MDIDTEKQKQNKRTVREDREAIRGKLNGDEREQWKRRELSSKFKKREPLMALKHK